MDSPIDDLSIPPNSPLLISVSFYFHVFISFLSVAVNLVALHLVVFHTDKSSQAYKKHLIVVVAVCMLTELDLNILFAPVPGFPAPCGYSMGVLYRLVGLSLHVNLVKLPIPVKLISIQGVLVNIWVMVPCFIFRHQAVMRLNRRYLLSRWQSFALHLIIFCYYNSLIVVIPILHDSPQKRLETIDKARAMPPCGKRFVQYYSTWPASERDQLDCYNSNMTTVAAIALPSMAFIILFSLILCLHIDHTLSHSTLMSERTRSLQKALTQALVHQCSVPMICIVGPALLFMAQLAIGFTSSVLPIAGLAVLGTHATVQGIVLIATTKSYRNALHRSYLNFLPRRFSSTVHPAPTSDSHKSLRVFPLSLSLTKK